MARRLFERQATLALQVLCSEGDIGAQDSPASSQPVPDSAAASPAAADTAWPNGLALPPIRTHVPQAKPVDRGAAAAAAPLSQLEPTECLTLNVRDS